MSAPFYISPEQWFTEKAEYARKGIARGKPIVAVEYDGGIAIVAENRSASLRKISEIYDRIAFAGVGKFDEYENLRKAGVRYADLRGYSFCREDVSGRSLANEYSTVLGSVFTREMKALEVEILVAEVGEEKGSSAFYQIMYDGFIADHTHFAAIGGDSERLLDELRRSWQEGMPLDGAVKLCVRALESAPNGTSGLEAPNLEVGLLDRSRSGRKFVRPRNEEVRQLLGG